MAHGWIIATAALLAPAAATAQDALPAPGQPTPWLDLQSVSTGAVDASSAAAAAAPSGPPPLELNWELLQKDFKFIQHHRDGLMRTVDDMKRGFEREAWISSLDYALALDAIAQYYGKFSLQAPAGEKDKTVRYAGSFLAYYAAFTAQTRWALAWSEHYPAEKEKDRPWLNEAQPELGLPQDGFARLQRHLSGLRRENTPARAAERYVQLHESKEREWFWQRKEVEPLDFPLLHDARRLAERAKRPSAGEEEPWQPGSSWISQWMDVEVHRDDLEWVIVHPAHGLPDDQILNLNNELEPGDILVARRQPFRGDVGVPGYWDYAGVYLGTSEERKHFFGNEAVDSQLKNRFPKIYALIGAAEKPPIRVMEAGLDGVGFASLERLLEVESCAALRPRVPKIAIAEAILRLFQYAGRPYDDGFNADSDENFTGAKLALKAYEGRTDRPGLQFNLVRMYGHRVISANDFVKKFDAEFGLQGDAQQMDLVWFIENRRGAKKAARLTLEEFRASWRRPKWAFPARKNDENQSERSQ